MNRTLLLVLAASAMSLLGCRGSARPTAPTAPASLQQVVTRARETHRLPALAAATFTLDSMDVAVDGVRRLGATARVRPEDLFHIGSLAKGITATMIGTLVRDNTLAWSLRMSDAFPELASTMNPAYRDVTLDELLHNRSGLPGVNQLEEFLALPPFAGDAMAQRQAFASWLLQQPPAVPRGTYLYSTAGFALAAAIAERRTGVAWDTQVRNRLLAPLGADLFVGWPLEAGPNEPCGHMMVDGALEPIEPSAGHVPAALAPGGDASMTVADYARYAQLHLRALAGRTGALPDSVWRALHGPIGDYAMGWQVLSAGGETAYTHTGSAETFFAFVVLYAQARRGFVVITNATSPEVDGAIVDIVTAMAPRGGSALAMAAMRSWGRP